MKQLIMTLGLIVGLALSTVANGSSVSAQLRQMWIPFVDEIEDKPRTPAGYVAYTHEGQQLLLEPDSWEGQYRSSQNDHGFKISNMPGMYFGVVDGPDGLEFGIGDKRTTRGFDVHMPSSRAYRREQVDLSATLDPLGASVSASQGGTQVRPDTLQRAPIGRYWVGGAQGEGDYLPWTLQPVEQQQDSPFFGAWGGGN